MTVNINSGIDLIIPAKGEKNWDTVMATALTALSSHNHTGSGMGLSIGTTAIQNLAITTGKLADLAITTGKLADLEVTSAKILLDGPTLFSATDTNIVANTVDAADTKQISIGGGGSIDALRGAFIQMFGNEHSSPGLMNITCGNVAGAALVIRSAGAQPLSLGTDGVERWRIRETTGHLVPETNSVYDIGEIDTPKLVLNLSVKRVRSANTELELFTTTNHSLSLGTNNVQRWTISSSGDLNGDATNGGDLVFDKALKGPRVAVAQSVAATGTIQADAAAITANIVSITTGGENTGVIIPQGNGIGHEILLYNGTATNKKIYPSIGGTFDNGAANAPTILPTLKSVQLTCFTASGTTWITNRSG